MNLEQRPQTNLRIKLDVTALLVGLRSRWVVFLVFVFVTLHDFCMHAQEADTGLKLEGLVAATYSSRSNYVIGKKTARFETWLKDCSWRIRIEYLQSYDPGDRHIQYLDVFGDGINIFGIRANNQTPAKSQGVEQPPRLVPLGSIFRSNDGVMSDRSLEVPPGSGIRRLNPNAVAWALSSQVFRDEINDLSCPVWLTFASRCAFQGFKDGLMEPFISLGLAQGSLPNSATGVKIPVKITRSPENPEQITHILLYANGFRAAPAFADRAFTNAIYQALAFTNIAQSWIVTRAKLDVLLPTLPSRTAQDLATIVEYDVSLTNIVQGQAPSRPDLPPLTFVNDYRMAANGLVSYYVESNNWLSPSELMDSPLVLGIKGLTGNVVEPRSHRKRSNLSVFAISVAFLSLVVVVFALWKKEIKTST